jgi:hypothetical protein
MMQRMAHRVKKLITARLWLWALYLAFGISVVDCSWYGNLWKDYSSASATGDNSCGMPQGQGGAGAGGAGAGGADVGSGVGAGGSSIDVGSGAGGAPDPSPQTAPCDDGTDLGTYLRCRGLDPMTCEEMCFNIGATCAALKLHPFESAAGSGKLKQCMSNTTSHTCTYCYSATGEVCTFLYSVLTPTGAPFCSYTGGKGCE